MTKYSCHRERSAMCPLGMAISGCYLVIARDVAISPFSAGRNKKRDCRATLVFACHREERGDLSFQCGPKQKERLPRCARNDRQGCHRVVNLSSRGTKRSRVSGRAETKREIASQARSNCDECQAKSCLQSSFLRSRAFSIVNNLCMQATKATLLGFPAAIRR